MKHYFVVPMLFLATFAVTQTTTPSPVPSPAPPQPQKQLSLCAFQLVGASSKYFGGGLIGYELQAKHRPYFLGINEEVQHIYETVLKESSSFQYVDTEKLIDSEGQQSVSLADTAAKNNLSACVSAKPWWTAKSGWNKHVAINTWWEVAGPTGCKKLTFRTSVASNEKYGVLPHATDPALKSVYLELSKDDAAQFSEAFHKAMKKAGCGE